MFDLSRFFCCMVMHMSCSYKIDYALKMMKYLTNHEWKFKRPAFLFLSCLAEVTALVFIALTNYIVITESPDIMELAKDFTALTIISEIGQILASMDYFDGITS